ncbi:hypothetical protein KSP40_PGU004513 [Platanthera guangdongensis]|uniref:Plastid lipid-associated protein/fibrillin conserved domain-containing protein n=1 Tax=Platanthera guangdongensis TaxID=2320717 RepID=A0ABR2MR52_9ASPA
MATGETTMARRLPARPSGQEPTSEMAPSHLARYSRRAARNLSYGLLQGSGCGERPTQGSRPARLARPASQPSSLGQPVQLARTARPALRPARPPSSPAQPAQLARPARPARPPSSPGLARSAHQTSSHGLAEGEISKVKGTDRGVLLSKNGHKEVAEVARKLQNYCVGEPVKCPLIFGEWDVLYCSVPTSPGGGYRSSFGRLFLNAKEMVQVVESPDIVLNKVSFSLLGLLDGEVSLKGKLKAVDEKWIQVIFEPPELKIGSLGLKYGGESEVKLEITYIDDRIRLGRVPKALSFVFQKSVLRFLC